MCVFLHLSSCCAAVESSVSSSSVFSASSSSPRSRRCFSALVRATRSSSRSSWSSLSWASSSRIFFWARFFWAASSSILLGNHCQSRALIFHSDGLMQWFVIGSCRSADTHTWPAPPAAPPPSWRVALWVRRSEPAALRSGRVARWSLPPASCGSSPAPDAASPRAADGLNDTQTAHLIQRNFL